MNIMWKRWTIACFLCLFTYSVINRIGCVCVCVCAWMLPGRTVMVSSAWFIFFVMLLLQNYKFSEWWPEFDILQVFRFLLFIPYPIFFPVEWASIVYTQNKNSAINESIVSVTCSTLYWAMNNPGFFQVGLKMVQSSYEIGWKMSKNQFDEWIYLENSDRCVSIQTNSKSKRISIILFCVFYIKTMLK